MESDSDFAVIQVRPVSSCFVTFADSFLQLLINRHEVLPKRASSGVEEAGKDEDAAAEAGGEGFTDATFTSLSMILVSEVFWGADATL